MGLAPSRRRETLGKSLVAKVPVPIYSQPPRASILPTKTRKLLDSLENSVMNQPSRRPTTLRELRDSGWQPKSIKQEIRDNFCGCWRRGTSCFRGSSDSRAP
jgi:hypothetical protein